MKDILGLRSCLNLLRLRFHGTNDEFARMLNSPEVMSKVTVDVPRRSKPDAKRRRWRINAYK